MKILLKSAQVIQKSSPHHGQQVDILIRNGKIEKIAPAIPEEKDFKIIVSQQLCVSQGWVDVGTHIGEPGYEHREDFESAIRAAAAGGFTALMPQPNTFPVVETKAAVRFIHSKTESSPVDFFPIAALTKNCEGKEITEMYDLREAGAVAFGDGKKSVQHGGVLLRALQYVKPFDGIVLHQATDESVSGKGHMHEGITSTFLGLKGIPALAESLMVQRDLSVLEYAESRLHFAHLSGKEAIELVRKAKKKGLKVTASVPMLHLAFTDEDLEDFDTNLKVSPPLRSKTDQAAIREALKDDTLDFIVSNHLPLDEEAKVLEFPYAEFGAIGLETTFSTACTFLKKYLPLEAIIYKMAETPREIFRLPKAIIETGAKANLTIFDPGIKWIYKEENIRSKSKNSPQIGKEFTGKVLGIVNKNQVVWND